uniref:Uncharacterized protein n=1 Tax=Anopheles epiroticus TaxID=199890 RepID=A0A182PF90_9DIPT
MPVSAELDDDEREDDDGRPEIPARRQDRDEEDEEEEDEEEDDLISVAGHEPDPTPVVQCHHERPMGSKSPYTMRPQYDHGSRSSMSSQSSQHSSSMHLPGHGEDSRDGGPMTMPHPAAHAPDVFVPMLHVRRDLHHKMGLIGRASATITSAGSGGGLLEPSGSFLSHIPLRKRAMGPDGEPHPIMSRSFHMPPGSRGHHKSHLVEDVHSGPPDSPHREPMPLMSPSVPSASPVLLSPHLPPGHLALPPPPPPPAPSSMAVPINLANLSNLPVVLPPAPAPSGPCSSSAASPHHHPGVIASPGSSTSVTSKGSVPPAAPAASSSSTAPQVVAPAAPPPPRKTGFSIEDIMRR